MLASCSRRVDAISRLVGEVAGSATVGQQFRAAVLRADLHGGGNAELRGVRRLCGSDCRG